MPVLRTERIAVELGLGDPSTFDPHPAFGPLLPISGDPVGGRRQALDIVTFCLPAVTCSIRPAGCALDGIGIAGGKIVTVAPSLPAADARRTISAKGRLVMPGLVDIHAHIFISASDMAGRTDHFCRASGVTTLCDAGRMLIP